MQHNATPSCADNRPRRRVKDIVICTTFSSRPRSRSRSSSLALNLLPISCHLPLLLSIWIQRLAGIITNALDDPQSFRSSLSKEQSISNSEILWSLNESEGYYRTVTGTDIRAINVDYSAGLRDRSDVQHCLVFCFDSSCMRKNEHFTTSVICN